MPFHTLSAALWAFGAWLLFLTVLRRKADKRSVLRRVRCADCAYWHPIDDDTGLCRHAARQYETQRMLASAGCEIGERRT